MKNLLISNVVLVLAVALTGCATKISSRTEQRSDAYYSEAEPCEFRVRDFGSATELPDGAKNLGWVTVEDTGEDEQTMRELRKRICAMGGDAASQMSWIKDPAEKQAKLQANVWSLP